MEIKLPWRVRVALYLLTAFGTPVVFYLRERGLIGDVELALWSAEVTVAGTVAAFHLDTGGKHRRGR